MNERGSISVYALIVLVPIVLFLGLLFDLARYRAADRMAEQQTKAAARSVLSAYDRTLRDEYGLFGLKAADADIEQLAAMPFEQTGGGFAAVAPQLAELRAEPVYALADHRFFRRQILEEMKIKGPVEFGRRVYDNWKDRAPDMKKAAETAEWSDKVEQHLQRREEALRDAFHAVERMADQFRQGYAILSLPQPQPPEPPEPSGQEEGGGQQEGGAQQEGGGQEPPRLPGLPPPPPQSQNPLQPNPYSGAWPVLNALQAELDALQSHLQRAREAEQGIAAEMNGETGDLLAGVGLYGNEYYTRYALEVGIPVSRFGAAASAANADPVHADIDLSFDAEFRQLFDRLSAEEQARRADYDDLEARKDEQRDKTREQLDKVQETLANQVCTPGEESPYARLTGYYDNYVQYNTAPDSGDMAPDAAAVLQQEPEQAQMSVLDMLRRLSDILAVIRDEALVNEYALLYFNHRVTGRDGEPLMAGVKNHVLKQEAEYVLYGLGSCTANRNAAYAEMFAARFAIRTVEALTDVRKTVTGSPLLILLTAAAEGAAKAFGDMEQLLDGKAVPVFRKSPNVRMGYADYLRVFLALHSNETRKMARMQALIQLNTGISLTERPVYVRAVSRSDLAFRLFPAAANWIAPGEVDGRSVTIEKLAEMAY